MNDIIKNSNYLIFVTGVVCLLVGIAIGWGLLKSGTQKTDIKWKFGNNELNINLDKDLETASIMLTKIFSEDFSKTGATEWLKEHQNLYEPHDPDIVEELATLEYDDITAKGLREIRKRREGPWDYQLDTVQIGIPAIEVQPKPGFANVCENGVYLTKKLRIYNILDQSKTIEVKASGKYECPKGLKYPDIQLNANDAKTLLGFINFSKYEQGMALIIIDE